MKIAVINNHIPVPSALVINTLKHADNFHKMGHQVEIFTVNTIIEKIWKFNIKNVHRFFDINPDIKINYFNENLLRFFNNSQIVRSIIEFLKNFPTFYSYLDPEIRISRECLIKEIELAYCRETFITAYYNILNKIPTIIESHNHTIPYKLKRVLQLKKSKYFVGISTISKYLKNNFIKCGVPEEKVLVNEDAVDLDKFKNININKNRIRKVLNLPLNKKIVIYSGNIRQDRGIATTLNSIKFLENENYEFYFIGGNKNLIKKWKKYKNNKNIKAKIHFLGLKPYKIIPYYLKAADVLLAQYAINTPTLKWMSPIKIFEYMGSKTPFIVNKIGRISEICDKSICLLNKLNDPKDLSDKIKLLINNEDLRKDLTEKAYDKASENTYLKRCEKLLNFANRALK